MYKWIDKLLSKAFALDSGRYDGLGSEVMPHPFIQNFPEVGVNGQVTLNLSVWATGSSLNQDVPLDQLPDSRVIRVPPQCVGAMLVECGKHGLHVSWVPTEPANPGSLGAFAGKEGAKADVQPAAERAK